MDKGSSRRGYGKPPWIFKGRALYQLHLVKANTVRSSIPNHFKLVQAFGYTLGGFFLANYDESPVGAFDELVVIAGLVWNPPTSCAWATKVFVNSNQACIHGRNQVGLPSHLANFSKTTTPVPRTRTFLDVIGMGTQVMKQDIIQVTGLSSFNITTKVPILKLDKWLGPTINLSLPSFSGRTETTPQLLKYSCKINCRVRGVEAAQVSTPNHPHCGDNTSNIIIDAVMLSKPIFALKFSCMTMQVDAPIVISDSPTTTSLSTT